VWVHRSGQTGVRGSKDCAAWRYLDGGHAPAVEHQQSITMGGAKHAGVFRKGFDDSLDDLSLVAGILKRDVKLVTAYQANPQLYFCHSTHPVLSRRPNPVAIRHSASVGPGQPTSIESSQSNAAE
jgi:hypothetical protein